MQDPSNVQAGTLYVVATPIGNLEDITLRALRILKEVDCIAAEDTRRTRKLLASYSITTSLVSLHEHNEQAKSATLVDRMLHGMNMAYVSDAGTPCLSDPGRLLVARACLHQIRVVPVPGVSAITAALSVSGLAADTFMFCGFLPSRAKARRDRLSALQNEESTLVFFESPSRFESALTDMSDILGDRQIVVCRELTKIYEEVLRGRLLELRSVGEICRAKGEFTMVVEGATRRQPEFTDESIRTLLLEAMNQGVSRRDAVASVVAKTGLPRKRIYGLALKPDTAAPGPR